MGWLIALAAVGLLAIVPLGVSARYDAGGALVLLIAGPVRLRLYPGRKKAEKEEEPQQDAPKKQTGGGAKSPASGGPVSDFLPLVRVILDFLGDFRRKLRVNRLVLKLTMAGEDPCDLAVNYGRASAALASLYPQLERFFVIKKQEISLDCDFETEKTRVIARLDVTITLGRLLSLGLRHGFRGIREYLNIMKFRKGGAVK